MSTVNAATGSESRQSLFPHSGTPPAPAQPRFSGGSHATRLLRVLAIAFFGFLVTACATVPITGRTQLNMVSDQQLVSAADLEFSNFMGAVSQKNAQLSRSESLQAPAILDMVSRVSNRVIEAAGLAGKYRWETVVVKSGAANAFVLPNGKIVVFTGLFSVAKTEGAVAAVIGHEVGHVVGRHQAERASQVLLAQLALAAADAALTASNSRYRPVIGAALGLGAVYGMLLPFSRTHESEADHLGLFYMAKAGYDPTEALGLWERMEANRGSGPWEFLSTHPSPETRRSQIREWLPEATLYYADRTRPLPSSLKEATAARAELDLKTSLAPVATRPDLGVGFWYRTKSSGRPDSTFRLEGFEPCHVGQCFKVQSDLGFALLDGDYSVAETRNADGSWTRFSPPLRRHRWPVRVGDTWSDRVVSEQSSGTKQTVELRGHVVSYESVTVPAGTFLAFKIILSAGGRRFREGWYAPETKIFVKTIEVDANDKQTVRELISFQRSDEPPSVTPAARPPSQATERLAEAMPLSAPPESGSRVSAAPPIVATATPQALRTPPRPDRPITAAWLIDARWEGTYRGSQVSLRISDDGPQGLTWVMVARRGSQTLVGQRGSVTVSGLDATLQGRDVNGVRVTFLLTRAAEALRGEVLVGDDPPEAVSLKGTR